eukprot:gnl/TRDRNA2_/TRDRNA2_226007_c0_seq1.p1 gnl/TRDRNA2_/TRDRNA2_226007_c0~~gnl/TRDRNA2_/TRDRNA2_226007_c0_seq1.p1  ORF type:complete len:111 (-),score=20.68 gnl/TRDRNA2_/TRDRNA2_226007_c0_seq1:37-369(-)
MENDKFVAFFEAMDLHTDDAWGLFKLMDQDESLTIEVDEFVEGCLKLKGSSKNLDFSQMVQESRWLRKRLSRFMVYVEQQFALLRSDKSQKIILTEGMTAPPPILQPPQL